MHIYMANKADSNSDFKKWTLWTEVDWTHHKSKLSSRSLINPQASDFCKGNSIFLGTITVSIVFFPSSRGSYLYIRPFIPYASDYRYSWRWRIMPHIAIEIWLPVKKPIVLMQLSSANGRSFVFSPRPFSRRGDVIHQAVSALVSDAPSSAPLLLLLEVEPEIRKRGAFQPSPRGGPSPPPPSFKPPPPPSPSPSFKHPPPPPTPASTPPFPAAASSPDGAIKGNHWGGWGWGGGGVAAVRTHTGGAAGGINIE